MQHEFSGVRTGKAWPASVENLQVEVHDSMMRIRELANTSVPEPRTLVIQRWDPGSIWPMKRKASRLAEVQVDGSARLLLSPSLPVSVSGAVFVMQSRQGVPVAVPAGFDAEEVLLLLTVVREALQ